MFVIFHSRFLFFDIYSFYDNKIFETASSNDVGVSLLDDLQIICGVCSTGFCYCFEYLTVRILVESDANDQCGGETTLTWRKLYEEIYDKLLYS